ncbi:hypothetical protein DPM19_04900 [Actinomadura craniellae]|uniref:Mce-associated membrane protein n=1 Tax=Actinomadura craniellae TaxID=2231787 RepID=A0A365HAY0_9ACTN|nr:hypothetical protein [Actinomadura craniellae]RAY16241.1 hypothetical protein DPM19_04900 [Actinomadura craniellae]
MTMPTESTRTEPAESTKAEELEASAPAEENEASTEADAGTKIEENDAVTEAGASTKGDTKGDTKSEGSDAGAQAEEAEEDAKAGERKAGRRISLSLRGLDRLTAAALVLVLAAALATAVVQWREASRLAAAKETEQRVRTRAAEFGQALLAYKHTDLAGARARIRGLTSADFGQSYETAFAGLAGVITKYKADATATVRDTYVNEIDGSRAKALVVLDSEVRSTAGVRRVVGTKLLLELVLEKGSWRVGALSSLEADSETMTGPDGKPQQPSGADPLAPAPKPSP